MIEVKICVGSSCHLKGAPAVVEEFKRIIDEKNLKDKINLKASFCQNNCTQGVNITVKDEKIADVDAEDVENIINKKILGEIVNEST
jgi:NADH:ubiquinone oxidoreductase subunit E